ncbi:hypothetical protein SAMN04488241_10612 [Sphingomonas rubra]|uniref:Uncharacterized protein n=1 Tax=Sphingomonas rubra TaxID=634430 RepID=A0A1I5SNL5_9SPHN|nr:hypothetical protein SAMN04488241_10612 [Sphingomonas rubra]
MIAVGTVAVDPALADALAEELVLASKLLADLAYDLGADEAVLRRHMASLQAIDQVTQTQLAVAAALRQLDRTGELLAGVTLEDMKTRLGRAMAAVS